MASRTEANFSVPQSLLTETLRYVQHQFESHAYLLMLLVLFNRYTEYTLILAPDGSAESCSIVKRHREIIQHSPYVGYTALSRQTIYLGRHLDKEAMK